MAVNFRVLPDFIKLHAQTRPTATAYTYMENEEEQSSPSITYRQLLQRVRSIAAFLTKLFHPQPAKGQRVLLLYPPGLDFICAFLGCLWCGVIAIPSYPPSSPSSARRDLKRIEVEE